MFFFPVQLYCFKIITSQLFSQLEISHLSSGLERKFPACPQPNICLSSYKVMGQSERELHADYGLEFFCISKKTIFFLGVGDKLPDCLIISIMLDVECNIQCSELLINNY